MGALTPEVVEQALIVQEFLLGDTGITCGISKDVFSMPELGEDRAEEGLAWPGELEASSLRTPSGTLFHSPLLYWNCSLSSIQQDSDLIETVNLNSMRVSPLNLTMHWGSVFAGKTISHQRLVAADALVLSLFYRTDSRVGKIWDERAAKLAEDANLNLKYDVYPPNGRVMKNTFYEVCWEKQVKCIRNRINDMF